MKKTRFYLFLLSWLLGLSPVLADEVSPYVVNFDGVENTGYNDFEEGWVPASGWSHDVKRNTYQYFSYRGNSTAGVDGSGCIKTGNFMDYSTYDYYNPGDALITPLVSGTISMQVKADSYQSGTAFYVYTQENGAWVQGELLKNAEWKNAAGDLVRDEWVEVTFTVSEPTHIGIVSYNCYLDDFKADKADIVKELKLKLSVSTYPTYSYVDTDADGNFTVSYGVVVRNTGDLDFEDETKTVKLVNAADPTVVYDSKPLPLLFVGETGDELTLTANITTTDYQPITFAITEDLTGSTVNGTTITPIPYAAALTLQVRGSYSMEDVALGDTIDFGTKQADETRTFGLKNDGGKNYVIGSVSLPEGYTTTLKAETVVEAHKSIEFDVVKTQGAAGLKEGLLEIKGTEAADTTVAVALTGYTVDETTWFLDFEDQVLPADVNIVGGEWRVSSVNYNLGLTNNKYSLQTTSADSVKFISPLLEVAEGDVLTFEAAKNNASSFVNIYYSADRTNWTLLKRIHATVEEGETDVEQFETKATSGWYTYYYYGKHTIEGIPAGQWYVAFEAGNANIDNISGFKKVAVERDLFLTKSTLPASGQVNSAYKASVVVKNSTVTDAPASSYVAKLYFDNKVVAQTEGEALKAGATATLSVEYTPHIADTYQVRIEVEGADRPVVTETVEAVIGQEQLSSDILIGNLPSTVRIQNSPVSAGYTSEGEIIYPAELLAEYGLKVGDKINKITLLGTNAGTSTEVAPYTVDNLTVTLGTTDNGNAYMPATPKEATNVRTIHEGTFTYPVVGAYESYSYTAYGNLMELPIEGEPYVYDGGNLVLHVTNIVSETASPRIGFLMDTDHSYYSIYRQVYGTDASQLDSRSYYNNYLPVTLIGIEAEAQTVSGKITDENGEEVKGVEVTLTAGDVLYTDVTNAAGKYDIEVLKGNLTYELKAVKAGYEPFAKTGVSVAEQSLKQDITLKEATGLYINVATVPAEGQVNHSLKAQVNVLNPLLQKVNDTDYTATLLIDNEVAAQAQTASLASLAEADLTFSYTPHVAGTHNAQIEIAYGEEKTTTDVFTLTVAEEEFGGLYQVLDSASQSSAGPIYASAALSETQTIYTAEQLGLPEGAVIKKLTYRGYAADGYYGPTDTKTHVKVWVENTELGTDYSSDSYSKLALDTTTEPDYETDVEIKTVGRNDSLVVLLEVPVNVNYTGQNLRIVMTQQVADDSQSSSYIYWENGAVTQTWTRTAYSKGQALGSWGNYNRAPVVRIEAVSRADVAGQVTDFKGQPVQNAVVSVESGDVFYTATTDAEGKYQVAVAQLGLDYTATVTAEGFETVSSLPVELVAADTITVNAELHTQAIVSGIVIDATTGEAIEGATVVLTKGENEVATTTTDAEGSYSLTVDDAEGDYTLTFKADGYFDADHTEAISNQDVVASLALQQVTRTLSGQVTLLDQGGDTPRPAANALVVVTDEEGHQYVVQTDADGRYSVTITRPAGTYTIVFSATGYITEQQTVQFNDDDAQASATLYSATAVGISSLLQRGITTATVHTADGRLVGRNVSLSTLPRGLYIISGQKVLVK